MDNIQILSQTSLRQLSLVEKNSSAILKRENFTSQKNKNVERNSENGGKMIEPNVVNSQRSSRVNYDDKDEAVVTICWCIRIKKKAKKASNLNYGNKIEDSLVANSSY